MTTLSAFDHRRIVACVGLSMLPHAAVIGFLRVDWQQKPSVDRLAKLEVKFRAEAAVVEVTPKLPYRGTRRKPASLPLEPPQQQSVERPTHTPPDADDAQERSPLNIDVAKIAREFAREKEEPSLNAPGLGFEARIGRAIAAAARADCRTAHSAMGILAIPFLMVDFLMDTGCKW
jgi:hypothetical protein